MYLSIDPKERYRFFKEGCLLLQVEEAQIKNSSQAFLKDASPFPSKNLAPLILRLWNLQKAAFFSSLSLFTTPDGKAYLEALSEEAALQRARHPAKSLHRVEQLFEALEEEDFLGSCWFYPGCSTQAALTQELLGLSWPQNRGEVLFVTKERTKSLVTKIKQQQELLGEVEFPAEPLYCGRLLGRFDAHRRCKKRDIAQQLLAERSLLSTTMMI